MENFLPALFIIGAAIYKIYQEYQKEQEKARQRRPKATPMPAVPTPGQAPQPAKPIYKQELPKVETLKETHANYVAQAKPQQKNIRNPLKQEVKPPIVEDEVENNKRSAFNLSEAIIQEAILRRPFQ